MWKSLYLNKWVAFTIKGGIIFYLICYHPKVFLLVSGVSGGGAIVRAWESVLYRIAAWQKIG